MDALKFFLDGHHGARQSVANGLLTGVPDDLLRARPQDGVNSIAWNLWHVARCEDVGTSRFVADLPQVLEVGAWTTAMNVPLRQWGTGMTDTEVTDLSERIDLTALRGYWEAVGQQTRDVVRSLRPEDLEEAVDDGRRRQILTGEGVLGPNARWVLDGGGPGSTKGIILRHLALTHVYLHYGEAMCIRGLLGLRWH
jgi:hypothetical protein